MARLAVAWGAADAGVFADMVQYDERARHLAATGALRPDALRGPGYPALLALAFAWPAIAVDGAGRQRAGGRRAGAADGGAGAGGRRRDTRLGSRGDRCRLSLARPVVDLSDARGPVCAAGGDGTGRAPSGSAVRSGGRSGDRPGNAHPLGRSRLVRGARGRVAPRAVGRRTRSPRSRPRADEVGAGSGRRMALFAARAAGAGTRLLFTSRVAGGPLLDATSGVNLLLGNNPRATGRLELGDEASLRKATSAARRRGRGNARAIAAGVSWAATSRRVGEARRRQGGVSVRIGRARTRVGLRPRLLRGAPRGWSPHRDW